MPKLYIEVTNTVNVDFISGIQRLTMRLLEELKQLKSRFELVPIVYCTSCKQWRHLNPVEEARLYRQRSFSLIDRIKRRARLNCPPALRIKALEPGSVFFDIESGWHNPYPRRALLADLKANGISTALLLSDIIPYLFPQYVHPKTITKFKAFFEAHLQYSDLIVCNSASTSETLKQQFGAQLQDGSITTAIALLGADYQSATPKKALSHRRFDHLGSFILTVGTIEPRKNFSLLLSVFDQIAERYPEIQLVFVGKQGWMSDAFFNQLEQHRFYKKRIFWYKDLDDQALAYLYQKATLFAFPSFFEGFGLPVAEALIQGLPTISSDRGALAEVGRDYAEYCDPEQPQQWVERLDHYLKYPKKLEEWRERIQGYRPPLWKEAAEQVLHLLESRFLH